MATTEKSGPPPSATAHNNKDSDNDNIIVEHHHHYPLIIVGGGIGGLVLALCLDQIYNHPDQNNNNTTEITTQKNHHHHLPIHIYESTTAYTSNAGGAIGLYPNGLRVLQYLSQSHPKLTNILSNVREGGCTYIYRRWMRHDGYEVAVAREDELLPDVEIIEVAGENENEDKIESSEEKDTKYTKKTNRLTYLPKDYTTATTTTTTTKTTSQEGDIDIEAQRANRRPRGGSLSLRRKSVRDLLFQSIGKLAIATTTTSADIEDVPPTTTNPKTAASSKIETDLLSLGIRRWKYQQILHDACVAAGIHIHFGKRLQSVSSISSSSSSEDDDDNNSENGHANKKTLLQFKDGSCVTTSLVIGADGINSRVRKYVTNPKTATVDQSANNEEEEEDYVPAYTGVTCLMGCANVPRPVRGICFPSSATTKCHACYYPTHAPKDTDGAIDTNKDPNNNKNKEEGETKEEWEQVFQIYFPSPIERTDTWRTLTPDEAKIECKELANKLRNDGWDEQFLVPLESDTLTGVLRVGLRSRDGLDCWNVGGSYDATRKFGRAVLLGDAAHPPVPYIGQVS